ncbi:MAG: glycosyltransferase family A protein [Gemmataceae bacterium]
MGKAGGPGHPIGEHATGHAIAPDQEVDSEGHSSPLPLSDAELPGPPLPGRSARKPTLSVLVPNYNDGHLIGQNLDAILGQSVPPDEVIVVDDGSTDLSLEVIEAYAKRDSRVRVLRNETNMGIIYSLNRALALARGDYVYGSSADDVVQPGFFAKAMEMLAKHPEAGMCFGFNSAQNSATGEVHPYRIPLSDWPRFFSPDELARAWGAIAIPGHSMSAPGNATIWRRTAHLEAGGYRKELRWHCDWFALQVVALRYGACFIPESVCNTRMDDASYSTKGQRIWEQQRLVLDNLLRLIKSPEFRDILPRFQTSLSLSQFAPGIVRLVCSQAAHWDHETAALIKNSLLAFGRQFLRDANAFVRRGAAMCLGCLGQEARGAIPDLCAAVSDCSDVSLTARTAIVNIRGAMPNAAQVYFNRLLVRLRNFVRSGGRGLVRRCRGLAARAYRLVTGRLTRRLDTIEHRLAELHTTYRKDVKESVQALRVLQEEVESLKAGQQEAYPECPEYSFTPESTRKDTNAAA